MATGSLKPQFVNNRIAISTKGTATPIIRGRLLPYLHFRLSDIPPTIGSVTASHNVPNEIIAPANAADRPTTSVKKYSP